MRTYSKLPVALERGEGSYVWDDEGNRYLDFYGGHCVTAIGHCPPRVSKAIADQARRLMFYSNAVYSPLRAETARAMMELAPPHLAQVFFCNSGTEANEAALKLARKFTRRMHVVSMTGGFHGRTLGSLAVTDGDSYRSPFESLLAETSFVPFGDIATLERTLAKTPTAAVILEPIQSMAGIVMADKEYYQAVARACRDHGTLLIFDEIQTGVGRTGSFSISTQLDVQPDIVTMAKSLGSGVPVGATLVNQTLADAAQYGDQGTTFGGGMIAMAAVRATLDTLIADELMSRAPQVFDHISAAAAELGVTCSGKGCLIGIDLGRPTKPVRAALLKRGVLVGGSANPNVIRIFPPLTVEDSEIDEFFGALGAALDATTADAAGPGRTDG